MSTQSTNLAAEVCRLVGEHPGIDRKGLLALFPEDLADELDLTEKRLACCLGNQITKRRLTRSETGGYTVRPDAKPVRTRRPDAPRQRGDMMPHRAPLEDGRQQPSAGSASSGDGQQQPSAGTKPPESAPAAAEPQGGHDEASRAAGAEAREDPTLIALHVLATSARRALITYVHATCDATLHDLLATMTTAYSAEEHYRKQMEGRA